MRCAQIRERDIGNGPGIRVTFFVSGCTHNCQGCFNELYKDFAYGELWLQEHTQKILAALEKPYIHGLTILGGEPFQNIDGLLDILPQIKQGMRKDQDIWIYSGYTWEDLLIRPKALDVLLMCDVLVDGPFILAKRDLNLHFRGSSNQRIIDIKRSYNAQEKSKAGEGESVVLWQSKLW